MFWDRLFKKGDPKGTKFPKPKEMNQVVGMYLVTKLKQDPDWVWSLYCVTLPRQDGLRRFDVRVYNRSKVAKAGGSVANYHSLDSHPEWIIYEGHFDTDTREVVLEDKRIEQAA